MDRYYKEFTTVEDATGYSGPSPSVIEQQDDAQYAGDFATMEACFRMELESRGLVQVLRTVANVIHHGAVMSTDHWLADFRERWGDAKLLRALARACEPNRLTEPSDEVIHK